MNNTSPIAADFRFRRLRRTGALRDLVRETRLHPSDFIRPIFGQEGIQEPVAIDSMPGVFRYPEEQLAAQLQAGWKKGIRAVLLFGVSSHKDAIGADTWNDQGLMTRMIRGAKPLSPRCVSSAITVFANTPSMAIAVS